MNKANAKLIYVVAAGEVAGPSSSHLAYVPDHLRARPCHTTSSTRRIGRVLRLLAWPTTFVTDRASVPPAFAVLTAGQCRVWSSMRVRIKRVPPRRSLEGWTYCLMPSKKGKSMTSHYASSTDV